MISYLLVVCYCFFFVNICGGVVQLVRTSACHAEGREFEPRLSRHSPWSSLVNPSKATFFIFRGVVLHAFIVLSTHILRVFLFTPQNQNALFVFIDRF